MPRQKSKFVIQQLDPDPGHDGLWFDVAVDETPESTADCLRLIRQNQFEGVLRIVAVKKTFTSKVVQQEKLQITSPPDTDVVLGKQI